MQKITIIQTKCYIANAAAHAVGLVTNVLSSQGPAIHDTTVLDINNSMLSGVTRFVDTGVQAMKQDPNDLVASKPTNKLVSNIAQESLSAQIPVLTEIVDLTDVTKHNPTERVVDSPNTNLQSRKQEATRSTIALVTTELLENNTQTAGQNNAKSVLTDDGKSVTFGKPKARKPHSKKSLRQLSEADTNALLCLKHYEDYLWLQFYKVYSVGATLQGEDQVLPAFIHLVTGDHKESDGYKTSADDEIKPLIEEKN